MASAPYVAREPLVASYFYNGPMYITASRPSLSTHNTNTDSSSRIDASKSQWPRAGPSPQLSSSFPSRWLLLLWHHQLAHPRPPPLGNLSGDGMIPITTNDLLPASSANSLTTGRAGGVAIQRELLSGDGMIPITTKDLLPASSAKSLTTGRASGVAIQRELLSVMA